MDILSADGADEFRREVKRPSVWAASFSLASTTVVLLVRQRGTIMTTVGSGFMAFHTEAPAVAAKHMDFVRAHAEASALDEKTEELAYLAVLAALRMTGGLPFHVAQAKAKGASRAEVASAVLVGLPAAGLAVLDALPIATAAWEAAEPDPKPGEGD